MKRQRIVFPVIALATLGTLVVLGFNFHHDIPTDETKARSKTSALTESVASESAEPTTKEDYLAKTAAEAARYTATHKSAPATQSADPVRRSNEIPSSLTSSRTPSAAAAAPVEALAEVVTDQPRMPLVFLDSTGVLPNTPEVAATVQKLRQDFIDSTGAATANPEDPNYAALWNQFQPTADDIFCAIFGTEACNSLSIAEAHQRGHF